MKQKKLGKVWLYLLCFLIAFLFITISSQNSFLYQLNDWVDGNCFFTIGRGMLHGMVPYRDLFDQKGPLLYFIYMLGALFTEKNMLGVYFLEIISFSVFLYFAYRTCRLFLSQTVSGFCLPILSMIIVTLPAFTHGGSAEEFCLPFLMGSLYSLLKFWKEKKEFPHYRMLFLNGLSAGCVLLIKYTMLGFWFALMMCFFFLLLGKRQYKRAVLSCFVFLGGMVLPLLPWLLYFGCHGALKDFFETYVIFNIKYYPNKDPWYLKVLGVVNKTSHFLITNLGYGIPLIIGMISLLFTKDFYTNGKAKWNILLCFLFLVFFVLIGGKAYRYYYLIFTPFAILGLISIGKWVSESHKISVQKNYCYTFFIVLFLLVEISCYGVPNSKKLWSEKQEGRNQPVQWYFASIMKKSKDRTLLNYGSLDAGFYLATETLPVDKYFQKVNIDDEIYPENIESQKRVIREKKVQYVITRERVDKTTQVPYLSTISHNYQRIASKEETYEEKRFRYVLWERK